MNSVDRRRTPARPDLAADHLRGRVAAERFVAGRPMRLACEIADLLSTPSDAGSRQTQILMGERLSVFEISNGWAWAQLAGDDYVGYVKERYLSEEAGTPTHCVAVPRTFLYASDSIKSAVLSALPMGAALRCGAAQGEFFSHEQGGFVHAAHLTGIGAWEADFVAVAERFLNAPYLWGGKSWLGLDCSGLVQLALSRAGVRAPRDTDMMEAELGAMLELGAPLQRGDLVFWKGHVGIMQDERRLLHANGHHMLVISEPLDQVSARVRDAKGGEVTRVKRIG